MPNGRRHLPTAAVIAQTGEQANFAQGHSGLVTDIEFAPDETYFITSSKDTTAKVRIAATAPFLA